MSLDLSRLKSRLSSISNTNQKSNLIWKPKPGKQVVRIVPYKYVPDNPFIELKFHYNINNKTYLSPDSFGRPDPIVEFANRLKKTGSKEDWQMGRKMEPKMRTFVPAIIRGEEGEGVKFWGFGKQVYQELLSIISDPDFGDITDLTNGRDIVVEFKTAEGGASFPETSIRVKPNVSLAVDPKNAQLMEALKSQVNILDLFEELSYNDLKDVMDKWLNPDSEEDTETPIASKATDEEEEDDFLAEMNKPVEQTYKLDTAAAKTSNADKFDDLFS